MHISGGWLFQKLQGFEEQKRKQKQVELRNLGPAASHHLPCVVDVSPTPRPGLLSMAALRCTAAFALEPFGALGGPGLSCQAGSLLFQPVLCQAE